MLFFTGQQCESDVVVEVFTGKTFEQQRFKPAPFYSELGIKREFPHTKDLFCAWEDTKACMFIKYFKNFFLFSVQSK